MIEIKKETFHMILEKKRPKAEYMAKYKQKTNKKRFYHTIMKEEIWRQTLEKDHIKKRESMMKVITGDQSLIKKRNVGLIEKK